MTLFSAFFVSQYIYLQHTKVFWKLRSTDYTSLSIVEGKESIWVGNLGMKRHLCIAAIYRASLPWRGRYKKETLVHFRTSMNFWGKLLISKSMFFFKATCSLREHESPFSVFYSLTEKNNHTGKANMDLLCCFAENELIISLSKTSIASHVYWFFCFAPNYFDRMKWNASHVRN